MRAGGVGGGGRGGWEKKEVDGESVKEVKTNRQTDRDSENETNPSKDTH